MRVKAIAAYLEGQNERERKEYGMQLERIKKLYDSEVEILDSVCLGEEIPKEADLVLIPQLFGSVFHQRESLEKISIPIMLVTSEFGTVEMWDWEIAAWLRDELKLNVFFPYNCEMAKVIFRSVSVKKQMKEGIRFLMFQDSPGEGMQAYLFKKFYWWNESCTQQIERAFGVRILYKSYRELNERAAGISDAEAEKLWEQRKVPVEGVSLKAVLNAVKLYMAIKETADETGNVYGVGCNCLNESFLSCTTPCLAWNWLFEYDHMIWACEGDTITMLSKFVMYSALKKPMMMTNIYPFLIGMAALKHEKIKEFPQIDDPDNHALGVHCGYFGFAPESFCSRWVMRPKVLEIVNEQAVAVDCEMKTGDITMAKIRPDMKKITIIEAAIEDYVQYPGSDCRNGALIRYRNRSGHKVMEKLSSHHAILIQGDVTYLLIEMAKILGIEYEVI